MKKEERKLKKEERNQKKPARKKNESSIEAGATSSRNAPEMAPHDFFLVPKTVIDGATGSF